MDLVVVRENTECLVRLHSFRVDDITHPLGQYIKQEGLTVGPNGKEARATRLITERASRRIGQIAFELASKRPRKVRPSQTSLFRVYSQLY